MAIATPKNWEERLERYLQSNGLRMTRQRLAIAKIFFDHAGHPNIDELYDAVRHRDASIGQATVYRTLKLLVDSGLAHQSRFGDGTTRYESAGGEHHDHIICVDCGRIVEFRNDTIERLQEQIAIDNGFEMTDHEMIIYGRCVDPPCTAPKRQRRRHEPPLGQTAEQLRAETSQLHTKQPAAQPDATPLADSRQDPLDRGGLGSRRED